MEIDLRTIATFDEAKPHLESFIEHGQRALADLDQDPPQEGFLEHHLRANLGSPESLLLVAESEHGLANLGVCLVGPHVDPLGGQKQPMLLILSVDSSVRHRALAGTLVKEARRILRRRGFETLAARVPSGDDALVSMGERWGFVRTWEFLS
ncbi:MAG: ribosomal protein S18 acetylase RimI-like enzyme [Candidatus Paceibacteria bacterium]|jgi:ribosomal protein S18 acetylase RimI-like enzyme